MSYSLLGKKYSILFTTYSFHVLNSDFFFVKIKFKMTSNFINLFLIYWFGVVPWYDPPPKKKRRTILSFRILQFYFVIWFWLKTKISQFFSKMENNFCGLWKKWQLKCVFSVNFLFLLFCLFSYLVLFCFV